MRGEIRQGDECNAYCPVCQPTGEDRDKRLYYRREDDKWLVDCKHGCDHAEILKHFPKKDENNKRELIREHVYINADGSTFGKKQIWRNSDGKKSPAWMRFSAGEFVYGLNGAKADLYNVRGLLANKTDTVWIVEGEKDADTLTKAGLLAVSPPHGASFWARRYNVYFRGRDVVIVPDNDEAGRKHIERLEKNLTRFAKSVGLIDLRDIAPELKENGDASDVFEEVPDARGELLRLAAEAEPSAARSHDVQFTENHEGKPLKTIENFQTLLDYYGVTIRGNSISGMEVSGERLLSEDDAAIVSLYSMNNECGLGLRKSDVVDFTSVIAKINEYNPVLDWLAGLDSNAKGGIRRYFNCLNLDDNERGNTEIYLGLFVRWLIQCIAMQFNSMGQPFGADGALGLQCAEQGIGKTSFFRLLCFDQRYFKASVHIDPSDTNSVRVATSVWICELGEVESTLTKDLNRLKGFMTEEYSRYKIPYATALTTAPRRTSFCFTCNSRNFLKDDQNRRFWTIPITGVDLDALKAIDIRGVWGEAYALYRRKPQGFRLSKTELDFLKRNNREKFGYRTNEEEVLRDCLDFELDESEWSYMTATDISDQLFGDRRHSWHVGKVLCDKMDYVERNGEARKHFRILRGIKAYFVPLKKPPGYTKYGYTR